MSGGRGEIARANRCVCRLGVVVAYQLSSERPMINLHQQWLALSKEWRKYSEKLQLRVALSVGGMHAENDGRADTGVEPSE